VGGWALGIFIFGFLFPGINNWAHGGGLLSGLLMGSILGYQEKSTENRFHKGLAIMCILATLGTLFWAVLSAFLILFSSRLS
jgi:rhomboid protease GluP